MRARRRRLQRIFLELVPSSGRSVPSTLANMPVHQIVPSGARLRIVRPRAERRHGPFLERHLHRSGNHDRPAAAAAPGNSWRDSPPVHRCPTFETAPSIERIDPILARVAARIDDQMTWHGTPCTCSGLCLCRRPSGSAGGDASRPGRGPDSLDTARIEKRNAAVIKGTSDCLDMSPPNITTASRPGPLRRAR